MDLVPYFLERHANIHGMNHRRLFEGLDGAGARARPRADVNSVAWCVWHIARCEDVGVNRVVRGSPQVLDTGQWAIKMGVSRRDIGTGMTDDEVSALSEQIDVDALRGYWAAVGAATQQVVRSLGPDVLQATVDAAALRSILAADGVIGPHAGWVEEFWQNHPRGWFLFHLGLTHNYQHIGEALVVRGMLGQRSR